MKYHDAANIFPLDEEHIDELAKDIKEHEQQVPIELLDGQIIDGRRRWLACKKAKVEPWTVEVSKTDVPDPVAYVLSLNLHRRHLTISEAAMCAQRARKVYDDAAKERQKASGGDKKSIAAKSVVANCPQPINGAKARDQVGEAFGVSGQSVDRAAHVQRDGIPELVQAVDERKVSVSKAASIASNPAELQQQLLAETLQTVSSKNNSPKATPSKDKKSSKPEGTLQGVGVIRANEAINCLSRIPKRDQLRKRGFQIVSDWIRANK